MSAAQHLRACLAVIVCAAVLIVVAFYEELFLPKWQTHEITETTTPSGDVGVSIADTYRVPPTIEVVLRIAIPLLALLGVAAFVARTVTTHKVLKGAAACTCAALITLIALQVVMARRLGVGYLPSVMTVSIWVAVSLAIGAASAWAFAVRWPNKSLERTRER